MRDEIKYLVVIGGLVAGAIIFMFQTFATVTWVKSKHQEVTSHLNRMHNTQLRQSDKLDRVLEHLIK